MNGSAAAAGSATGPTTICADAVPGSALASSTCRIWTMRSSNLWIMTAFYCSSTSTGILPLPFLSAPSALPRIAPVAFPGSVTFCA